MSLVVVGLLDMLDYFLSANVLDCGFESACFIGFDEENDFAINSFFDDIFERLLFCMSLD